MTEIIQTISAIVTGVALPLLGVFLFYDAKRGKQQQRRARPKPKTLHNMQRNGENSMKKK